MIKKQIDLDEIKKMDEGQFRYDMFRKLDFDFIPGRSILDIGCGTGYNSVIFKRIYKLRVTTTDIYKHENISKFGLNFNLASATKLPYASDLFDYVFLHDVLHHIDEPNQNRGMHIKALSEIRRVSKPDGYIIIVEANRYNPLFYPHMVKIQKHNHFTQPYFVKLVKEVFPEAELKFSEIHYYNSKIQWFWDIYEKVMELISPNIFKAYNIAIIDNKKTK